MNANSPALQLEDQPLFGEGAEHARAYVVEQDVLDIEEVDGIGGQGGPERLTRASDQTLHTLTDRRTDRMGGRPRLGIERQTGAGLEVEAGRRHVASWAWLLAHPMEDEA